MRCDIVVLTQCGLRTTAGGPRAVRSPCAWQSRRAEDAQGVCKRRPPYSEDARERTRASRAEARKPLPPRSKELLIPSVDPSHILHFVVVRTSCQLERERDRLAALQQDELQQLQLGTLLQHEQTHEAPSQDRLNHAPTRCGFVGCGDGGDAAADDSGDHGGLFGSGSGFFSTEI